MFLNPLMLAGLGAAVIPLVLHLLSKARYRPIEWGAMMFLESAHGRQQRTAKVKQMILLLLRIGIIAGLALGMARPILRPILGRGGAAPNSDVEEARVHAIIIVDRSASMGYEDNGRSRLTAAKQAVVNILSTLHRGDEISLILMGDGSESSDVQPTTDLQSVASRIGSLTPAYSRARIDLALERASLVLTRNPQTQQEVYLVCDHQANSWENLNDAIAQNWRQAQRKLSSPPRLFVIPVGGDEADNVAIESISLPGPPPVRDIDCDVQVTLRNFGSVPRSELPLALSANNHVLAQTTVNLPPNSSATARLSVKFAASGSQVIAARVESNGMRFDDESDLAVNVLEPVRVLIVNGGAAEHRQNQPDVLPLALSPHQSAGQRGADPATVRIVGDDDWWGLSPDRDDVVVLNNISQLSNDRVRELEQFVYSGGGLIVAPGDLADAETYNADYFRNGEGFLPASFAAGAPMPMSPVRLKQADMNHPVFTFLHGEAQPFTAPIIRRWMNTNDLGPDARVLATFTNGQPFLVERAYGAGRVLMLATSLDGAWTNLPLSDFYLPFVQSLARYAAGAALPDRNLHVGEPLELALAHAPADALVNVLLPDGQTRAVLGIQMGGRWTLRFTDTSQPGEYVVTPGQSIAPIAFAVAAGRAESDLTPLTDARWAWLQKSLDFRRIETDRSAIADAAAAARSAREGYLPIIALVIALAMCELTLARMWTRK